MPELLYQPLRFFLAARYARKEELRVYRQDIETLGHVVISNWIDGEGDGADLNSLEAVICMENDVTALLQSDFLGNGTTKVW